MIQQLFTVVGHDFRTETKRRYAFGGILLYVVSAVFITYLAFLKVLDPDVWNALFWIILLFASVNAAAKSFMAESSGKMLYYFFLIDPRAFILGKTIYNTALLLIVGFICYFLFNVLHQHPIQTPALFLCALVLGCIGLAGILTLVSSIASKTGHNFTLMSILSFPLLLPLMLLVIRLTTFSISGLEFAQGSKYLISLISLDILILALSYLLFPYLWKE